MGSFFVYQHYSVTTILQIVTRISILNNVILGSSLQYRSSKITPSLFAECSSLFPIKEGIFLPLRLSCKESSTFSPSPSSSGSGDVTALRCSEPLRYKVDGASKPSPNCAGWDRLGITCYNLL